MLASSENFRVTFANRQKSVVTELYSRYPSRLISPREGKKCATVYLSNYGGGLVQNDEVIGKCKVLPGATGLITTSSHQLVYGKRATDGSRGGSRGSSRSSRGGSRGSSSSNCDPQRSRSPTPPPSPPPPAALLPPCGRTFITAQVAPEGLCLIVPQVTQMYPAAATRNDTHVILEGSKSGGSLGSAFVLEWTQAEDWKKVVQFHSRLKLDVVADGYADGHSDHPATSSKSPATVPSNSFDKSTTIVDERLSVTGESPTAPLFGYKCLGQCLIVGPRLKELTQRLTREFTAMRQPIERQEEQVIHRRQGRVVVPSTLVPGVVVTASPFEAEVASIRVSGISLKFLGENSTDIATALHGLCREAWEQAGGCPFVRRIVHETERLFA